MRIVVELGGDPRGKGRGRAFVTKVRDQAIGKLKPVARVYTDEKTRGYEAQLRFAAQQQMGDEVPFEVPCRVIVEARFEVPQSWSNKRTVDALQGRVRPATTPDCDNLLKCLDAFNNIVWRDDRQVVEARVSKIYSERPGLTVIVETISAPVPRLSVAAASDLFATSEQG